ncbi:MAG TPA: hypothetical protein VEK33_25725 [Terriglobales bacterium]|nr:hypothetical protein [Terriglobales bacterium]
MSLKSFLEGNADVRAQFLAHFKKPDFRLTSPLLAPPLSENYGLVGTAFDYLLRFYLEKLNPGTKSGPWIADSGLEILLANSDRARARVAMRLMAEAKERYNAFLKSTRTGPSPALIKATLWLASFDVVFRAGLLDLRLPTRVQDVLVKDLQKMLSLVPKEHFRAKKRCVLNPTFGRGSLLVGGADGDLIIDDTLVDIKTTKHLTFEREFFNQLIGYYVLSCIGGIDDCARGKITHVAIYYARYGVLHRVSLSDCHNQSDLPKFIRWFQQRARS